MVVDCATIIAWIGSIIPIIHMLRYVVIALISLCLAAYELKQVIGLFRK